MVLTTMHRIARSYGDVYYVVTFPYAAIGWLLTNSGASGIDVLDVCNRPEFGFGQCWHFFHFVVQVVL